MKYGIKDLPVTYFSDRFSQDYHMLTDEPRYIEYEHAARWGDFVHDVMMALANRNDRPAISGQRSLFPGAGKRRASPELLIRVSSLPPHRWRGTF